MIKRVYCAMTDSDKMGRQAGAQQIEKVEAILRETCGVLPDGAGLYDWQIEVVAREIVSALLVEVAATAPPNSASAA